MTGIPAPRYSATFVGLDPVFEKQGAMSDSPTSPAASISGMSCERTLRTTMSSSPRPAAREGLEQAVVEALAGPASPLDVFVAEHAAAIEEELRAGRDRRDHVCDRRGQIAPGVHDLRAPAKRGHEAAHDAAPRLPHLD